MQGAVALTLTLLGILGGLGLFLWVVRRSADARDPVERWRVARGVVFLALVFVILVTVGILLIATQPQHSRNTGGEYVRDRNT